MSNVRSAGWLVAGTLAALVLTVDPCGAQTPEREPADPLRTPLGITGVGQLVVPVSDLDLAIEFYTTKLGLQRVTLPADAADETESREGEAATAELAIAGSSTRLLLRVDPEGAGSLRGVSLAGPDPATLYRELEARGVEFEERPPGQETAPPAFRDLDGNRFVLTLERTPIVPLPTGLWSGTLGDVRTTRLSFPVSYEDDELRIRLIVHGVDYRLQGIQYDGRTLGFVWRSGPVLECTLYRQLDGGYAGTCVNPADGAVQTLAMVPPS